ncbi:MAG TPA: SRPBCC domain-containing protein [Chryseolinea sp.]|jgi:uncharacterized protein YndB with AHSA1/START domain|nr:SRPBCC domain-containing protein [Chryseolinea sp.]
MEDNRQAEKPIIVETTFAVDLNEVWQALTDKDQMKEWYFDIKDFRPEPGAEFKFYAGDEKTQYLHLCQIKEVTPRRKISYTWKYDYDPGVSLVTFEIFPEGNRTRLKLTHEGIHNFSKDHPELGKENFVKGWNEIVNSGLKNYLENKFE